MATVKDLKIKVRINSLITNLRDKGDTDQRPGRDGAQTKSIIQIPEMALPATEWDIRIEKAVQVLTYGYWVDPDDVPPTVVTEDATEVAATGAVLNGRVDSKTVETTVNFNYGLTKALGTVVAADESPVSGATPDTVSKTLAGLTASTKYYYRVQIANSIRNMDGLLKSFVTPAAV